MSAVLRSLFFTACLPLFCACAHEAAPADEQDNQAPSDEGASPCVDRDGDGFGEGCDEGPDCDDADDTRFEECDLCAEPDEGCPCDPEAAPVACEVDASEVPKDGFLCKDGRRYCRDGSWSECVGIATFQ